MQKYFGNMQWPKFLNRISVPVNKNANRIFPIGTIITSTSTESLSCQSTIDLLPDFVCILDMNGFIRSSNTIVKEILNIDIGQSMESYLHRDSIFEFREALKQLPQEHALVTPVVKLEIVLKDSLSLKKKYDLSTIDWEIRTNITNQAIMLLGRFRTVINIFKITLLDLNVLLVGKIKLMSR
jgi:hypothetical protein